ncbi:hypothetical protein K7432_013901 [Basidiobolus ranarum]|uniref:PTR2-domain-containing protein n=1 Tax=Basidiobolus ranarum TaxID=34480 RepID=A0ABR2VQ59_9FUNG
MCGWLLLTCTSIPKAIEIGAGFPGYILSLIIIGLGTGGIKPLVSPMAADQLRLSKPEIRVVKGEKVIIDPTLTTQHLYNWFYWSINVGALIGGVITPELELHVGFWLAYMVPSCMFAVALMVFVSGSKYYVRIPPSGESTIVKAYHCIRFALKREKGSNPKPRHYLDAAKTNSPEGVRPETDEEKSYKYWDDSFVDGLKQTLMACFIFIPMCIYWTAYNQITSNLISQAASMQLPPSIPDDIIGNIDPIALIIFIPIMDTLVYPFLRRIRMNPRPMMRITIGFALGALAMMTSALVQQRIYNAADRGEPKISVWWQIPSYFLIAMSEIFASITSLEYSYTHAPNSLKGLVMALSLFPNAVAAAIGMALAPVAQNPYLVWNYGGISVATGICGIGFYYAFRHYDDLDDENDAKNMVITEDEIELDKLDD